MSLVNRETGQQVSPLTELQQRNEIRKEQTDNALLKEALAISNAKCNNLIELQNSLVAGLKQEVSFLKSSNEGYLINQTDAVVKMRQDLRETIESERQFKSQVSQELEKALRSTANEITEHAKYEIDKAIVPVKEELNQTVKEIEKQRADMQIEGGFRKFMFWATPILLLAQSIVSIFLLLR